MAIIPDNVDEYKQYMDSLSLLGDSIHRLNIYSRGDNEMLKLSNDLFDSWSVLQECVERAVIIDNSITIRLDDREQFITALAQSREFYLKLKKRMEELGYLPFCSMYCEN